MVAFPESLKEGSRGGGLFMFRPFLAPMKPHFLAPHETPFPCPLLGGGAPQGAGVGSPTWRRTCWGLRSPALCPTPLPPSRGGGFLRFAHLPAPFRSPAYSPPLGRGLFMFRPFLAPMKPHFLAPHETPFPCPLLGGGAPQGRGWGLPAWGERAGQKGAGSV